MRLNLRRMTWHGSLWPDTLELSNLRDSREPFASNDVLKLEKTCISWAYFTIYLLRCVIGTTRNPLSSRCFPSQHCNGITTKVRRSHGKQPSQLMPHSLKWIRMVLFSWSATGGIQPKGWQSPARAWGVRGARENFQGHALRIAGKCPVSEKE